MNRQASLRGNCLASALIVRYISGPLASRSFYLRVAPCRINMPTLPQLAHLVGPIFIRIVCGFSVGLIATHSLIGCLWLSRSKPKTSY